MADLIDRCKFIASMQPWLDIECYNDGERNMLKCILSELVAAQSVEAEPVVRCKVCKYQDKGENESESWNVCRYRPWLYFSVNDDDYCSNGERKDG